MDFFSTASVIDTPVRAYRGEIYALEDDELELRRLGVELGRFNPRWLCFEDCHVSPTAVERLQALGGKYLCDLRPLATRYLH